MSDSAGDVSNDAAGTRSSNPSVDLLGLYARSDARALTLSIAVADLSALPAQTMYQRFALTFDYDGFQVSLEAGRFTNGYQGDWFQFNAGSTTVALEGAFDEHASRVTMVVPFAVINAYLPTKDPETGAAMPRMHEGSQIDDFSLSALSEMQLHRGTTPMTGDPRSTGDTAYSYRPFVIGP